MLCLRTLGPALAASSLLALVLGAVPLRAVAQQQLAPDAGAPAAPLADAGPAPSDAAVSATVPLEGLGGAEVVPPPAVPPPALQRCIVIDAAPYGVDPVVGRYVSQTMRTTAAELGYAVLTPDESVAAAQAVRMPYPPAPADLWRATWAARAARGVFARVWAERGQYVVELTVASADGGGPFAARGGASAQDLVATVGRLTREALPPPDVSTAPQAQPVPGAQLPGAQLPGAQVAASAEAPSQPSTPPRRRRGRARRWVFATQLDLAFGASRDFFFNALLGARLDYRITPDIRLGAYFGYANLRGKDGRASNLLVLAQVEDRVRVSSGTDVRVPLRLGVGYLPKNGPVVRLAAGIGFPVSNRVELTFDLLAPTFWVIPGRTVISLDVGVEVGYRF
jgi:hypothetical protein